MTPCKRQASLKIEEAVIFVPETDLTVSSKPSELFLDPIKHNNIPKKFQVQLLSGLYGTSHLEHVLLPGFDLILNTENRGFLFLGTERSQTGKRWWDTFWSGKRENTIICLGLQPTIELFEVD